MEHLDEIPAEDLQQALDEVERKKPTQRLLAAIAYKNGVTQTELAEWYDVQRRTIYSWLKRLENEPFAQAVSDDIRPGRPRKITIFKQNILEQVVHEPPTEVGYDAPAWTPTLARQFNVRALRRELLGPELPAVAEGSGPELLEASSNSCRSGSRRP